MTTGKEYACSWLFKSYHDVSVLNSTLRPLIGSQLGAVESLAAMIVARKWGLGTRLTCTFRVAALRSSVPSFWACNSSPLQSPFSTITITITPPTSAIFRSAKRPWKRSKVLPSGTEWTVTKLQPTTISQQAVSKRSLAPGKMEMPVHGRPTSGYHAAVHGRWSLEVEGSRDCNLTS